MAEAESSASSVDSSSGGMALDRMEVLDEIGASDGIEAFVVAWAGGRTCRDGLEFVACVPIFLHSELRWRMRRFAASKSLRRGLHYAACRRGDS